MPKSGELKLGQLKLIVSHRIMWEFGQPKKLEHIFIL